MRKIYAADLFCGAGGATSALYAAARELEADVEMVAVNHWDVAIDTHQTNFPGVVHYCQMVGKVSPREAVPGGYLDALLAGPECVHHSRARGGKPKNKQSRASAFEVIWWLEELYVQNVLIENVEEFEDWGPLDEEDKPIPALKGAYFRLFVSALEELGYTVEWRKLIAANYGDPTTRKRLFLMATRGGAPLWPTESHRPVKDVARFPGAKSWVPARDIIDFSLPSVSIYEREKHGLQPLKPNTLKRIFAGMKKFAGLPFLVPNFGEADGREPRTHDLSAPAPTVTSHGAGCLVEPCLVVFRNNMDGKSVDAPAPTLCTEDHLGLAQPFVVINRAHGSGADGCSHDMDTTLRTLTTGGNMALAEPFLVKYYLGSDGVSLDAPLPTVTASYEHLALAEPFLMQAAQASEGHERRCYPLDRPVVTITTKNSTCLAEPFLVGNGGPQGSAKPQPIDKPLGTVLAANHRGVAQPFVIRYNGGLGRGQKLDEPLTTLDTSNRFALCQFVVSYYGNGENVCSLADPLATVTTRDRFGLVQLVAVGEGLWEGHIVGWLDILFRMLQPSELALAHSFAPTYVFTGTKEAKVKQIGNSWPVRTGTALVLSLLSRPSGMPTNPPVIPSLPPRARLTRMRDLLDAPVAQFAPDLFTTGVQEVAA